MNLHETSSNLPHFQESFFRREVDDKQMAALPYLATFAREPGFRGVMDFLDLVRNGEPLEALQGALSAYTKSLPKILINLGDIPQRAQDYLSTTSRDTWKHDTFLIQTTDLVDYLRTKKRATSSQNKLTHMKESEAFQRAQNDVNMINPTFSITGIHDPISDHYFKSRYMRYLVSDVEKKGKTGSFINKQEAQAIYLHTATMIADMIKSTLEEFVDVELIVPKNDGSYERVYPLTNDYQIPQLQIGSQTIEGGHQIIKFKAVTYEREQIEIRDVKTGMSLKNFADIKKAIAASPQRDRYTRAFVNKEMALDLRNQIATSLYTLLLCIKHDEYGRTFETIIEHIAQSCNSILSSGFQLQKDQILPSSLITLAALSIADDYFLKREDKAQLEHKPHLVTYLFENAPLGTVDSGNAEGVDPDRISQVIFESSSSVRTPYSGTEMRNLNKEETETLKNQVGWVMTGTPKSLLSVSQLNFGIPEDTLPYVLWHEGKITYNQNSVFINSSHAQKLTDGLLYLPLPQNSKIDAVIFKEFVTGVPLRAGIDYHVEIQNELGTTRVRVVNEQLKDGHFTFELVTEITKSPKKSNNSDFPLFSRLQMMRLESHLEKLGYSLVSKKLRAKLDEYSYMDEFSLDDILHTIHTSSDYSYNPIYHLLGEGEFLNRARGFVDPISGKLQVQCNSANTFYTEILNFLFGDNSKYKAVVMTTHNLQNRILEQDQDHAQIFRMSINSVLHAKTYVLHNGKVAAILDATPDDSGSVSRPVIFRPNQIEALPSKRESFIVTFTQVISEMGKTKDIVSYIKKMNIDPSDPLTQTLRLLIDLKHNNFQSPSTAEILSQTQIIRERLQKFTKRSFENPHLLRQYPIYFDATVMMYLQKVLSSLEAFAQL